MASLPICLQSSGVEQMSCGNPEDAEGEWVGDKFVFTEDYCLLGFDPRSAKEAKEIEDTFHRCRRLCLLAADIQRRLDHGVWPIFVPLLTRQLKALKHLIKKVDIDIRHAVWSSLPPDADGFVYFE
jgi:hypothetical protein